MSEQTQGRALLAPAKINLTLEILGRRADGYHELESLVVFAALGDELAVAPSDRLELEVTGPFAAELAGPQEDNLVLRAARLLAKAAKREEEGACLRLTKNLPVGAGLGGGSSDAAVVLRELNSLWNLSFSPDRLAELALSLGADLPACLYGRPVLVRGIGEQLSPAPPLPPFWIVLANPGRSLPTAAVYRARGGPFSRSSGWWEAPLSNLNEFVGYLQAKKNDLQAPAIQLCREIEVVLLALSQTQGVRLARMSGSGATCFAIYAQEEKARAASDALRAAYPHWWIACAPLLEQQPC